MFKSIGTIAVLSILLAACAHAPKQDVASNVAEEPAIYSDRMPAAQCKDSSKRYKECKNARANDIADQYMLQDSGDFWRYVNGKACQITNDVDDFRVSMHKDDAAVIYYKRNGDLYVLHNQGDVRSSNCPATSKKVIMSAVKEFKVVSNTNTTIVNAALDRSGNFIAWDATKPIYTERGVEDFVMNTCFGSQGKAFSSYVLFTIDHSGTVTKVKMNPSHFGAYNASKEDSRRYRDLSDFKSINRVCN